MEATPIEYVYTLSDPTTGEVRYVGRTRRPRQRKYTHTHKPVFATNPFEFWRRELVSRGTPPRFSVVAVMAADVAVDFEAQLIADYSEDGRLLNISGHHSIPVRKCVALWSWAAEWTVAGKLRKGRKAQVSLLSCGHHAYRAAPFTVDRQGTNRHYCYECAGYPAPHRVV